MHTELQVCGFSLGVCGRNLDSSCSGKDTLGQRQEDTPVHTHRGVRKGAGHTFSFME